MPDDVGDRDAALARAIAKLDDDLAWRGPNGRVMAYVLLPRADAEVVRDTLRGIVSGTR